MTSDNPAMHDLGRAIDDWLGELARSGRTERTRAKYYDVLRDLHRMYGRKALPEITAADVRAFLDQWTRHRPPRRGTKTPRPPASPATLALYVTVLRGFFGYCHNEGWVSPNPTERLTRPKRARPEDIAVVTVGADDVNKLFGACDDWDELLCIAVLAYLGPRRSAAANVKRSDVDLERGTIRFLEKGGKVADKMVPHELAAIIRAADQHGIWPTGDAYLIPNRRAPKSKRRSHKVIYAIVKRVAERAGVVVHPHAIRAAFAVQYDEQHPREIWSLKELLGHSRIETTLVYLRRKDRARAMESVLDLSWGSPVFPPNRSMPPAGFEPALGAGAVPDAVRLKLEQLRARSKGRTPGAV